MKKRYKSNIAWTVLLLASLTVYGQCFVTWTDPCGGRSTSCGSCDPSNPNASQWCNSWNSFVEEVVTKSEGDKNEWRQDSGKSKVNKPKTLNEICGKAEPVLLHGRKVRRRGGNRGKRSQRSCRQATEIE